jgi:methylmalonyl-CoA/ethylmalonyl-CoA epimerase
MENNVLGTKVITLIGILVHDIEKTSQAYADFFGIGEASVDHDRYGG